MRGKTIISILMVCIIVLCIGCGNKAKKTEKNSQPANNTQTVQTTVKEEPKLSAEERQQKINELSQGMDVKNDDMTGTAGYIAPSTTMSVDIGAPQMEVNGVATIYRLAAIRDSKGQKSLIERFELNSLKPNFHQIDYNGVIMKSKDKTYTPKYDFNKVNVSSHLGDVVVFTFFNYPANDQRIAEIREALNTGYLKFRLQDRNTKEIFDRELSNEEIQLLTKVLQIYDLL